MTIWTSTPDAAPATSGYVFGISEVDGTGTLKIGEPLYQYYYGYGTALTASRIPFKLVFSVDRTFVKGNIIGFLAIVGSTTKGRDYQVYFDSPPANPLAELTILNVPIPESPQTTTAVTMILVVFCSYAIIRRRN